jgi:hypothetical protein
MQEEKVDRDLAINFLSIATPFDSKKQPKLA